MARVRIVLAWALLVAGGVSCGGGDEVIPAPRILEFLSSERAVSRGRPVTLSWLVEAERVTVVQLPATLLIDTTELQGNLRTEPIFGNETFEITAFRDGRQVSKRLTVTFLGSEADVEILSFDANTEVVSPGEDVVLSWRIVNASGANILVGETPVASGIELPNGTVTVNPTETTEYTLEAQGEGGPVQRTQTINVRRPQVLLFDADPRRIRLGRSVTLSWSVALASAITIEEVGGASVFSGSDPSGTVEVSPTEDTTYLLTATDAANFTATAMVQVEVDRPVQAVIVAFEATPSTGDIGDPITLSWQVENASGGVEISSPQGVLHTSTDLIGTTTVRVGETTTFTLRALSAGGDAEGTATVTILPSAPYVLDFRATPDPVARGAPLVLSWSTLGATSIEVRQGANVLATTADAAGAVTYSTSASTPDSTPFSLVVSNANGTRTATASATAIDAPRIVTFGANFETFTGSATVTITWATQNATSLSLTRSGVLVPAFPGTPSGTFSTFVSRTTLFELRASNPAATAARVLFIAETTGEIEPNDTPATAVQTIAAGGQVVGQIASPVDQDWYAIAVPPGGSILAETTDGAGSCALDTVVELYVRDAGAMNATLLASDDDSGPGPCSRIDPAVVDAAKDLPGGGRTYYVVVKSKGVPGPYTLSVAPRPASCGNGIREVLAGEQCDGTPGCDAMCRRVFTPAGTMTAFGSQTFTNSIQTPTEEDLYRIDVPAGGAWLVARTYAPSAPNCAADTVLELFDRNFVRVATNDQSGADDCSSLHPSVDGAALNLIGGRPYYLAVTEAGRDGVIAAYQLALSLLPKDVCGNGVVEGTETCDDGGVVAGDGCSVTCTYPGANESEPNDTSAAADAVTGGFGRGTLASPTDVDWFVYSISPANAGNSLRIRGRGPSGSCRVEQGAADTAFELWGDDGMGGLTRIAADRDSGADERCSDIDPVFEAGASLLASGSYFIRVSGDGGSTGPYLFEVAEIAPACGNGIREPTEQCDDGGVTAGDGCNATCALEITGTSSVTPAVFQGPIAFQGYATYQLDAIAANSAIAVTTAPIGGGQCNIETGVQLLDGTGAPVGPFYQGGPNGSTCGQIPAFDPGVSNLAAGTYYLLVFNLGPAQAGVTTTITRF